MAKHQPTLTTDAGNMLWMTLKLPHLGRVSSAQIPNLVLSIHFGGRRIPKLHRTNPAGKAPDHPKALPYANPRPSLYPPNRPTMAISETTGEHPKNFIPLLRMEMRPWKETICSPNTEHPNPAFIPLIEQCPWCPSKPSGQPSRPQPATQPTPHCANPRNSSANCASGLTTLRWHVEVETWPVTIATRWATCHEHALVHRGCVLAARL